MNAQCTYCGITAADLPYEEMGLTLTEASETLFHPAGNTVLCEACK